MTIDTAGVEEIAFGPFRLDPRGRTLSRDGVDVALGARSLDILCMLTAARGNLVTKDELMARVWPGLAVEDNTIQVHVSALRKALGEDASGRRYILTVPGRGYRFIAEFAETGPALPDKPSIAVLPFQNMSGDPEQDYFADGIVEDIITALSRFPSLFVIARNSSFTYKGRSVDIRQVGRELGVRYVLEGSVRKSGNRVRISGQLVQAETGMHAWAEHYDGDLTDIFALQDQMTASVVGALVPSLQWAEVERARKNPPTNLDAYDLYLHALALRSTLTREGVDEALRLTERALVLDPNFVSAALLASQCWTLLFAEGWSPMAQAHAQSVRYARLAVRLDAHNADALAVLARRIAQAERDYEEASSLAERAMAINPNSAEVWRYSGFVFLYIGEGERAFDYFQRALRLSPRDAGAYDSLSGLALALIQLQRDQEAVAAARQALQLNPKYTTSWRAFAAALALAGRLDEAKGAAHRLLELDPTCSIATIEARYGHSQRASVRYYEGLRRAGLPE